MKKLDKIIPIRFSEEQWTKIKARAKERGRTASDLVRWIVRMHLESVAKEDK